MALHMGNCGLFAPDLRLKSYHNVFQWPGGFKTPTGRVGGKGVVDICETYARQIGSFPQVGG